MRRSVLPEPFASWFDGLQLAEIFLYALLATRISYILDLADVLLSDLSEKEKAEKAAALAMLAYWLEVEAMYQCSPRKFVDRLRAAYGLESAKVHALEREVSEKFPHTSARFKAAAAGSRFKARFALLFGAVFEKLARAFETLPRGAFIFAYKPLEWEPTVYKGKVIEAEEGAQNLSKWLAFILTIEIEEKKVLLPWWLHWLVKDARTRGGDYKRALKWALAAAQEGFEHRRWEGAEALKELLALNVYAKMDSITMETAQQLSQLELQIKQRKGAIERKTSEVESEEVPEAEVRGGGEEEARAPPSEPCADPSECRYCPLRGDCDWGSYREEGERRRGEEDEGERSGYYDYEDSDWERRLDEEEREVRESWLDDSWRGSWEERWMERRSEERRWDSYGGAW